MKLRIRANTLRLRLVRAEVDELLATGQTREVMPVPGAALAYAFVLLGIVSARMATTHCWRAINFRSCTHHRSWRFGLEFVSANSRGLCIAVLRIDDQRMSSGRTTFIVGSRNAPRVSKLAHTTVGRCRLSGG